MGRDSSEPPGKAGVFIDAAYLALAMKQIGASTKIFDLDLEKMCDELVGAYSRLRTYFYNVVPPNEQTAKSVRDFHTDLGLGDRIEVRLGKMQKTPGDRKDRQKQVDVLLALDMFRLASSGKMDMAILVSGDGDFVPLLQAVKDEGVLTKVVYAPNSFDNDLRIVADGHLEIGASDLRRWELKRTGGS